MSLETGPPWLDAYFLVSEEFNSCLSPVLPLLRRLLGPLHRLDDAE
jgi:hypothetical protein